MSAKESIHIELNTFSLTSVLKSKDFMVETPSRCDGAGGFKQCVRREREIPILPFRSLRKAQKNRFKITQLSLVYINRANREQIFIASPSDRCPLPSTLNS